jgi:hypothetical protein
MKNHFLSRFADLRRFKDMKASTTTPLASTAASTSAERASEDSSLIAPLQYEPLDPTKNQIRLFRFSRTSYGKVAGTLRHVDLDPDPEKCIPYRALSYTWGSSANLQKIYINEKPFLVRLNLFNCLTELQRSGFCDEIWIDQICIDQKIIKEKNHQVGMMADIYRSAVEVFVWLGVLDKLNMEIVEAIDEYEKRGTVMAKCKEKSNLQQRESLGMLITMWRNERWLRRTRISLHSKDGSFFQANEYWSRLWIVQELVLARRIVVCCGPRRIAWRTLVNLVIGDDDPDDIDIRPPQHIESLLDRGEGRYSLNFFQAITELYAQQCSEPRDKVYGLMSAARVKHFVGIDYDKPIIDVFFDAFRVLMADLESTIGAQHFSNWIDIGFRGLFKLASVMMPEKFENMPEESLEVLLESIYGGEGYPVWKENTEVNSAELIRTAEARFRDLLQA